MDAINSKLCTYRCYNSKYCLVLYISTFLISDLHIHDTIVWMKWEGLPIFFGMVTAAFEGIGLVSIRIYLIIENSKILVGLKGNFFMPPRSKIGGHIVFVLSVILSFCNSVIL